MRLLALLSLFAMTSAYFPEVSGSWRSIAAGKVVMSSSPVSIEASEELSLLSSPYAFRIASAQGAVWGFVATETALKAGLDSDGKGYPKCRSPGEGVCFKCPGNSTGSCGVYFNECPARCPSLTNGTCPALHWCNAFLRTETKLFIFSVPNAPGATVHCPLIPDEMTFSASMKSSAAVYAGVFEPVGVVPGPDQWTCTASRQ